MCGIIAAISANCSPLELEQKIELMSAEQGHRGPDASDNLLQAEAGGRQLLGLAHKRLSIFDPSTNAQQPMSSACKRYHIVFNGAIYNYQELKAELGANPLLERSSGDTAVLLAAYMKWGPECFERLNGMWALAIFDRQKNTLCISRDRFGIKPLYFYRGKNEFLIASEQKAIRKVITSELTLNKETVHRFLVQSLSCSSEETFFDQIKSFPPASYCELPLGNIPNAIEAKRFWIHPLEREEKDLGPVSTEDIRQEFFNSVSKRLRSDVPLGIMLSGGIDSTAILSASSKLMPQQPEVFSVISDDPKYSEESFIRIAAKHFNCKPHFYNIEPSLTSLLGLVDRIQWHNDEPIWSFKVIAHYKLLQSVANSGIKVVLSGQGADEQLAGYNKFLYFYLQQLVRSRDFPTALSLICSFLQRGTVFTEFRFSEAKRYLGRFGASHSIASCLSPEYSGFPLVDTSLGQSFCERERLDLTSLSVPKLLHYEDRMSMAHGLELRVPFLDHKLVELLARVPTEEKLSKGWTKLCFREAMKEHLPEEICWRKDKKGYSIPEDVWCRGELSSEISKLKSQNSKLVKFGIVDPKKLEKSIDGFFRGHSAVGTKEILSLYFLDRWLESNPEISSQ